MLELGKLFNHNRCWSFWFLCIFAPIGFGIIACKDGQYYRWDKPILDPPNAVYHRVSNPEYVPEQLPITTHINDESIHYIVPGAVMEDNIYLQQENNQNKKHDIRSHSISKAIKIPSRNPHSKLMSRYNRMGESPCTPPEEIV